MVKNKKVTRIGKLLPLSGLQQYTKDIYNQNTIFLHDKLPFLYFVNFFFFLSGRSSTSTSSPAEKLKVRDGIFKLLRSPGIDSKESIPRNQFRQHVAWRADKTTLFLLGS
jgi:hypothetical protein